jgi:hypothetical protein
MHTSLGIVPHFANFEFPVSDFDFLAKRLSQSLGSRLQLALQSIHLLRDVRQLFLGEFSRLNNLMRLAVCLAHRCAYSHCYSRQPALLGHRVLLLQRHSSYIGPEVQPNLSIATFQSRVPTAGPRSDLAFFWLVLVFRGRFFRAAKIVADDHPDNPGVDAGRFREKVGVLVERDVCFAKKGVNGHRAGDQHKYTHDDDG